MLPIMLTEQFFQGNVQLISSKWFGPQYLPLLKTNFVNSANPHLDIYIDLYHPTVIAKQLRGT